MFVCFDDVFTEFSFGRKPMYSVVKELWSKTLVMVNKKNGSIFKEVF